MYQEVITAISTVGFPIVACIGVFILNHKQIVSQAQAHKEEMDKLTQVLINNTSALTELSTLIKEGKNG